MSLIDRLKRIDNEQNLSEDTEFKDDILKALSQKISSIPVWYEYTRERQIELINNFLDNQLNTQFKNTKLSEEEKSEIADAFLTQAKGFGVLDLLLAKSFVNGVIVNASGAVFVETSSGVQKEKVRLSEKEIYTITKRFVTNSPVTSVRVDNFLITIISQPVSDCAFIIRKVNETKETLSDLTKNCIMPEEIERFLIQILKERKNIIISGNVNSGKSTFLHILINSINAEKRFILFHECGRTGISSDNVMEFNVSSLNSEDFENLLSVSVKTMPDYTISDLNNSLYASSVYDYLTPDMKGVVVSVRGTNINTALSKFINFTMLSQKSTEKQAKIRLSSQFDYIVHLEKSDDGNTRIKSIMEITSTKSNSLVQNEIAKLEENHYILDLPELASIENQEISDIPSATFLSRLSSFP